MTKGTISPDSLPPQRKPQEVYYLRNREVIVPEGALAVGQVVGVHGLRGELRVELHTDFPDRFRAGVQLFMGPDMEEVTIELARPHKGGMLVKLRGFDDRMSAETCRGAWLFIDETNAAELDEDVYWIHDLIGLQVVTDAGAPLGTLSDVLVTGANDVYVVQPSAGINRGREILIPAIAEVVQQVDLAAHIMTVRLPDGLIDV